jgi:hypothetical protein
VSECVGYLVARLVAHSLHVLYCDSKASYNFETVEVTGVVTNELTVDERSVVGFTGNAFGKDLFCPSA